MNAGTKIAWMKVACVGLGAMLTAGCARDGSVVRARKATTMDRRCATIAVCQQYMDQIRERVYENWDVRKLEPGTVLIGFKLDVNGNPSAVRTLRADSEELGRSCRSALAYAAPFGLLPASLGFLDNEPLTLEFSVPPPVAARGRKASRAR